MSLSVNLATLAEGAATDSRGSVTLVGVNPYILVADELPTQLSPVYYVVVEEDEGTPEGSRVISPGRVLSAKVEVTSPDGEVVFVTQLRQVILPPPLPWAASRLQVIAQLPFTASKSGNYHASAHVAVLGDQERTLEEISAVRKLKVADAAALKPKSLSQR